MKDFSRAGGRLRALPAPARVVYSVFLVFTLAAMGITAWLANDMVGLDLSRVGSYYAGEPAPTQGTPQTPPEGDGPALELPDDVPAAIAEAMPRRKLLEVTHFHLFSMPVYLLVLSHLFMLSTVGNGKKIGWIVGGTVATALHIAAPWIAASGTAASTWVYGVSGAGLAVSYLVMSVVPLWEMWAPARRAAPPAAAA